MLPGTRAAPDTPSPADGQLASAMLEPSMPGPSVPEPSMQRPPKDQVAGRMLRSERGEHVYVDGGSGLSLLSFFKATMKKQMSASHTTMQPDSQGILDVPEQAAVPMPAGVDFAMKTTLLQSSCIATQGICDVYNKDELEYYLLQDSQAQLEPESLKYAALNLAIAIGAQTRSSQPLDRQLATACFTTAREIAFKERLAHVSLDLVRVFLLMAFYTIGACRRHAAAMYVGIATTSAIMLGLHDTHQYTKCTETERLIRWRTYQCLLVMDFTAATLGGRPVLTPSMTAGEPVFGRQQQSVHTPNSAMGAAFDVCSLVHPQTQSTGQVACMTHELALATLGRLTAWGARWKGGISGIRMVEQEVSDPVHQTTIAGYLHIALIYYHAVILVTRKALVDRFAENTLHKTRTTETAISQSTRLERSCVDAAVCAAHICCEALDLGYLMPNQTQIVRPVIFEVGLILGFAMAVQDNDILHIEDAFRKARKVLEYLAKTTTLAKTFYDMLSSLLDAITMYRVEKSKRNTTNVSPRVERLFGFDTLIVQTSRETCPTDVPDLPSTEHHNNDDFGFRNSDSNFSTDQWQAFMNEISDFLPVESDYLNYSWENI